MEKTIPIPHMINRMGAGGESGKERRTSPSDMGR